MKARGLIMAAALVVPVVLASGCSGPSKDHRRNSAAQKEKAEKNVRKDVSADKKKEEAKEKKTPAAAGMKKLDTKTPQKDAQAKKGQADPAKLEALGRSLFDVARSGSAKPGDVLKFFPTPEDLKPLADKPEKLAKKLRDEEKITKKLKFWNEFCKQARFKSTKMGDEVMMSKDQAPEKYAKLAKHLTKPVRIVELKVYGKSPETKKKGKKGKKVKKSGGRKFKCSFMAMDLGSKGWRVFKMKECKWK